MLDPRARLRPARLLRAGPGRGLLQPVALRRGPLRDPGRRRRRRGHDAGHPGRRLRPRGQAPDHARHLRPVGRLLRRLLRPGPEGPHPHHQRLRRRLPALRRPPRGDHALDGLRHRSQGGRPHGHVPVRRLHGPVQPGRSPGHLHPLRRRRRRPAHRGAGAGPGAVRAAHLPGRPPSSRRRLRCCRPRRWPPPPGAGR